MKASWRPQEIVALLKRRGGAAATHGDVREPMRRRHPRATLRQDRGNFPRRRLPASTYYSKRQVRWVFQHLRQDLLL